MTEPIQKKFDQLIERMAYPTDTASLVEFMREHGKGDDVVNLAALLENRTFRNPDEVRRALGDKLFR